MHEQACNKCGGCKGLGATQCGVGKRERRGRKKGDNVKLVGGAQGLGDSVEQTTGGAQRLGDNAEKGGGAHGAERQYGADGRGARG